VSNEPTVATGIHEEAGCQDPFACDWVYKCLCCVVNMLRGKQEWGEYPCFHDYVESSKVHAMKEFVHGFKQGFTAWQ
jgi:hypothetical protein